MSAPSICESFRSLAFSTFNMLSRARRLDHQLLEETITDLNLLELKDRHSTEVTCRNFTKREEGLNGADWEWWLTNSAQTSWLGLRVQAKVLNLATGSFPHLHYRRGSSAYQSTKLKSSAFAAGLVPLYCYYLHDSRLSTILLEDCGTFPYAAESYGCSLGTVTAVERLRRAKRDDLRAVLADAVPWHCFVCCSGYGGSDLPSRAWSLVQNRLKAVRSGEEAVLDGYSLGPRGRPPPHVLAAIEGQEPESTPAGIRGVLVIRASNDA